MPNTGETQDQESTTDPNTSTEATDSTAEQKDPWDGIPEEWAWTKSAVESANREAASRRVALREVEDKLKEAKTPEEVQAATAEYQRKADELTAQLARERAARKHSLTDEVLEFLTGTTEEQIEAQAAKLAALKPSGETAPTRVITAPAPSGGVTPTHQPSEVDGRAAWKAYKDRR